MLAVAGCGGDDGDAGPAAPRDEPRTEAQGGGAPTEPPDERGPQEEAPEDEAPGEQAPGDDEGAEPTRIEVEVRARGRALAPRRVAVPSGIAVWLFLVSADGRPHAVRVEGRELAVSAARRRARLVLDPLPRNGEYRVEPAGGERNAVRIATVARPGP
jgi:hypothetical protein